MTSRLTPYPYSRALLKNPGSEEFGGAAAIRLAFANWLEERSFDLPKLIIGATTETGVGFAFDGWPELECSVTERGLDVAAVKDGECWDFLLSLDVAPVQRGSEWSCEICHNEGRPEMFATREALWRDHLFAPLDKWIVEALAPAERVEFFSIGCGSTWAQLV